ncbi:Phosphoserine phosphatase RsbP [Nocardioides dokdonensis FR1436]|uniref:Phosphoserine phosphatase RsbP n=1 Tax=Nocardioides dokdonensis FR1436 TaxID=1300347 RepID=A0A1A9GE22_9ACTN|nr:SpoIIE family protein phosphatase [Nocardioides dokdonensis]ANH36527.1 Phosphoserine phosphatase RsbP [Nocardioides dokdonensis FR1436]
MRHPEDPERYVEDVLACVEQVPRGRVTTYGAIAEAVGRYGPRRVGNVMATHGAAVAWWRVVRADGSLPPSHDAEARQAYLEEGTALRPSGSVDLGAAFFEPRPPLPDPSRDPLFELAGTLRAAYEEVDWARTCLGAPASWSPRLRSTLAMALDTRFAMALLWGPDLVLLYNEAFVELIADKHPSALGSRSADVFPEVWDQISPMLHGVLASGEPTWTVDALVPLQRSGFLEECYFTYSYSPVRAPDGGVEGIVDIVTETTRQVVARRRLQVLTRLGQNLSQASSAAALVELALQELRADPQDLAQVDLEPGALRDAFTLEGVARPGEGARARFALPTSDPRAPQQHLVLRLSDQLALDEDYVDFLRSLAGTLRQGLQVLAAREADRQISEALQRSLLTRPAHGPTLEVAVRYQPASEKARVGGDWYDAYVLPDGAVAVMVGDVAGHDQVAAAAMGQLRNLTRGVAYSARLALPARVLSDLDRAMAGLGVGEVATAVLAVVEDGGPDGQLLHWSNAGHPPPLVIEADGTVRLLEETPDLLLGLDPDTPRSDHRLRLRPGDTLLLYTDGLVERRGAGLDEGLAWLVGALAGWGGADPEALCDHLLGEVGVVEDDLVLLVLRART